MYVLYHSHGQLSIAKVTFQTRLAPFTTLTTPPSLMPLPMETQAMPLMHDLTQVMQLLLTPTTLMGFQIQATQLL